MQGPVPPEGPGLWGHGHMSKGMFYMVVAGILVDTSCCCWCLCALNFLVDLVFVTCCYYGLSLLGAVPPEGPGLWGQGHMSKGMIYIFVAGILVHTFLCFGCLVASNLHIDLVFVIFYYCGVSPIGAGAPRGSRALGARAHVERNALHFRGKYFGRHALMSLVSRCFEFASSPTNSTSPTTPTNPRPHNPPQRVCGLWRWC